MIRGNVFLFPQQRINRLFRCAREELFLPTSMGHIVTVCLITEGLTREA